jgi:HSP20 family protein
MVSRLFKTVREGVPSEIGSMPYHYGYQVTVGPDGKPRVREFGNIRPAAKGLIEQTGIREPLIDTSIDEKNNTLVITAEMPGVTKEDVKVNIHENYVAIHAEKDDKKYHSDIPINSELENASAKAVYSNGILELKIRLKKAPKPQSTEVKVE